MPRPDKKSVEREPPQSVPRVIAISPDDGAAIDLKSPAVAAALSWLVPGLGQLYQGRTLKGWLFMIPLLAAVVAGLVLGGGRVAYWQWGSGERRLAFLGQAGIGVVALPALLQAARLAGPAREPWLGSQWFAPPLRPGQPVSARYAAAVVRRDPDAEFDPPGPANLARCRVDQLSLWHRRLGRLFEIGTLYTVLAGMLNLLVVYDAWSGPLHDPRREPEADGKPPTEPRP
jgi:hypothetical protein